VLGEADAETAVAANNLAEVRIQQNRFDEGVALRRRASAMAHAGAGPDDNRTLEIDTDLGVALVRAGHPAEAEPIVRSVVDRRRRLTPNHPEFSKALSNLGGIDLALGNFPAAEPVLSEALDAGRRIDGEESATTLATLNLRCYALEGLERWDEAGKLYPRVLDGRRRLKGGEGQAGVQKTLAFMSRFYAKQQRWQDSARCLAELVLSLHRDPNRRPEALAGTIAAALGGEGDPKAAEPLLRECRDAVDSRLWPGDWFRVEIASRYGECLRRQGKFDEAKPVLEAAANDARQAVGVPAWGVPAARKRVADLYEAWKKPDEAAKWK
jgi:tetratricopeptide (TPR) repeat protein